MRAVKIALVIIITAVAINFIRGGEGFPLPRILPGCDGFPLSPMHFLAGLVLILFMLSGLRRLSRSTRETHSEDPEPRESLYEDTDDSCDDEPEDNEDI